MKKKKSNMVVCLSYKGLSASEPSPPIQPPPKTNINNNKSPTFSTNNNPEPMMEPSDSNALQVFENRKAPEGKDNDSMLENHLVDTKENSYTTDVNGKVTVHVVVTINGNGTLADLKKQRMQIRNNSDVNSITSPMGSMSDESTPSPATDIVRFTGETAEENVGYSKSKRCCVVQ